MDSNNSQPRFDSACLLAKLPRPGDSEVIYWHGCPQGGQEGKLAPPPEKPKKEKIRMKKCKLRNYTKS